MALLAASCGAPAGSTHPRQAIPIAALPSASAVASAAPPPADPLPSAAEALTIAKELVARAKLQDYLVDDDDLVRARGVGLDEARARTLVEAMAAACLASRADGDEVCASLTSGKDEDLGKTFATLVTYLGEASDPLPLGSRTVTLLVRLHARGAWQAGMALDHLLARRFAATRGACVAPTKEELDRAAASLADFVVVAPDRSVKGAPKWIARRPTESELADLAYFYASIATNGPPVGESVEDVSAIAPKPDEAALAERKKQRDEMKLALLDGDLARHASLADRYLKSLGYPGPIRAAEDRDARWGGAGFSFVLRDAARSAELLGKLELAADLYRRAAPGGGMCGTSNASRRDDQIEGTIRTAEASSGCRAVVAEHLFATDLRAETGPKRLADAGFDVERLYRGALLTVHRGDHAVLVQAIAAVPSLSQAATDRLTRLGDEAWSTRVRAIPGYADTARKKGIETLLAIAEGGAGSDRAEAVSAIGRLAQDRGYEPCAKSGFGWGVGSSDGARAIGSVMHACEGSLDATEMQKLVRRLAALRSDADPALRVAVARSLGETGSPAARSALRDLARDKVDVGGEVCRSRNGGPSVCQPNRPVRIAAEEALEAIDEAEANRKRVSEQLKSSP